MLCIVFVRGLRPSTLLNLKQDKPLLRSCLRGGQDTKSARPTDPAFEFLLLPSKALEQAFLCIKIACEPFQETSSILGVVFAAAQPKRL